MQKLPVGGLEKKEKHELPSYYASFQVWLKLSTSNKGGANERQWGNQPGLQGHPSPLLGEHVSPVSSQVTNYYPGYMEQAPSRGHGASPQSGLGVGCKLCSSSKELRGLSVGAQARQISIPLLFSVLGVSSFLFPPRSAMRLGA